MKKIILALTMVLALFSCKKEELANLTTNNVSEITFNSAKCGGEIVSDGNSFISARGICWSTEQNPTVSNSYTTDGNGNKSFLSTMSGLKESTTYFVRAYATNETGTAYGEEKSFTTLALDGQFVVNTKSVTSITSNSAMCGGTVVSDGNNAVTAKGVCWSTNQNPTIFDNHTSDGQGLGSYASHLINLNTGATYYVRAYANNNADTTYGEQKQFNTINTALPVVITSGASTVNPTSAICGGNVTSDGNSAVTAKGICWSTTSNPNAVSNSHTNNGTGLGGFTSNLSNLTIGTTYYIRAYATNNNGTAYGAQKTFTTITTSLPTVTTSNITNILSTTATFEGNVTSDGNSVVTAKGVCWSTTQNPTISGNHTSNGQGLGVFSGQLTNLTSGTLYYVRAYATNSSGTAYGPQKEFATPYTGSLTGVFSVSANQKVLISKGNLQYRASTNTFQFASNQYSTIGDDNYHISSTYSGWIDLFGWGTSGYNNKPPYMTSIINTDYGNGSNDISGTNYDWGVYCLISNGGSVGSWRTLTYSEWEYLINTRNNNSSYGNGQTSNNYLSFKCRLSISGTTYNGLMILPDNTITNIQTSNYADQAYENCPLFTSIPINAAFLPTTGYHYLSTGQNIIYVLGETISGCYWSGTHSSTSYYENTYSLYMEFYNSYISTSENRARSTGIAVRLVKFLTQ